MDMDACNREKDAGNEAFKAARYPEAVQHYSEALKRGPAKGAPPPTLLGRAGGAPCCGALLLR